jgi:ubiquinone biosynthesis protein
MRATTRRAGEVTAILVRHGAATVLDFLGVRTRGRRLRHAPVSPAHLRRALEELGPTFMKLGQVLSTRPDLVPPSFEIELARLQDSAPPVPTAAVVRAIESSLGRPVDDLYASFDPQPLAAASIGQVHAAQLPDGTDVVVKVRRPNVVDAVTVDLDLIERFAGIAAKRKFVERYDPAGLAHEFRVTMGGELDYVREAHNADAIAEAFAGEDRVHVPRVFWSHTCDGVITEERVRGSKIDDSAALDAAALREAGIDAALLARRACNILLKMVFEDGFFHADPHPGNFFVEPDGRIGLIDFGMVGQVAPGTRVGLGKVLLALVAVDVVQMADGLFDLGIVAGSIDRGAFERDLDRLLQRYAFVPLEQLRIGPLLNDVMSVVRAHRLRMPSDLALLIKTVMMCEGVAAKLDPSFELVPPLVPYAARLTADDG